MTTPLTPRDRVLAMLARRHCGLNEAERASAEAGDAWLLSRAGLVGWAGAVGVGVVISGWLEAVGDVHPAVAGLVGVPMAVAMLLAMVQAWFQPHSTLARMRQEFWWSNAILLGAALIQMALWRDRAEPWRWLAWLLPIVLMSLLQVLLAQWGRSHLDREMQRLRLEQERDAAAREAAEARLAALRSQIQPHFLFNTLAALQHWVDGSDPRAAPLLRELTGFLRGSTELMARDEVALADELALARHYLAIMQARFGERLQVELAVEPAALAQPWPPGLLLTLIENAIEHGIGPLLQGGRIVLAAGVADGRFRLTVQDTGPGPTPGWREGIGLANARERLARRFGPRAQLRLQALDPGACAEITIDPPTPSSPRSPHDAG
ncbi:sensor histidine kinase [Ideonella sp.]|uniref:sensor histidine kinase n=1 Tax=Ideonella sp. TaxID=1929293 RepID=UPI002E33E718|nr:histidine kinase [Ideonella sp.]